MQLFKQFWKLLSKNRQGLLIYSIIVLAMLLGIGMMAKNMFSEKGEESFVQSIKLSYVDNDGSVLSKGLIDFFSVNNTCKDYSELSDEEINDQVFFTISQFHIEIPENFQNRLQAGEDVHIEYVVSAQDASYARACVNTSDTFVNSFLSYRKLGFSDEEAVAKAAEGMSQKLEKKTYTEKQENSDFTMTEMIIYQMVIYLFYISFGLIALVAGTAMVNTNGRLVKPRIEAAPISPEKHILTNTLGIYSFGLVIWVVLSIAMFIAGIGIDTISERGWIISLGMLVMLLCNCSLTVLIAAFGPTGNTMSIVINIVGLSFSFMSGVFVPQWLLGKEVLNVARFLPSYWSTYAFNMCFPNSGAGLIYDSAEVLKSYGIVMVFAVVFVMGAMVIRKAKSQR